MHAGEWRARVRVIVAGGKVSTVSIWAGRGTTATTQDQGDIKMADLEARMRALVRQRDDIEVERRDWQELILERQSRGRVFALADEQEAERRRDLQTCDRELRETEQRIQRREGAMEALEGAARVWAAKQEERWAKEVRQMEVQIAERRGWIEASQGEEEARRARWEGMRRGTVGSE